MEYPEGELWQNLMVDLVATSNLRILILTQYYTPEPPFRPAELASSLKRRGHDVTVITAIPSYPYGRFYEGYKLRLWQWETIDGVRVLRLPVYPDHSHSSLRRALYFMSLAASVSVLGPLLVRCADVMYVYNDPNLGIPSFLLKYLRRIPFVYEVADIWPESLSATGMVNSGRLLAVVKGLVQFTCRQASVVTVVSPGFKTNLTQKGIQSDKIRFIPNWADEAIYRPVEGDPALAAETGLVGRFNVLYAGNMGFAQALHAVVQAAELTQDLPQVQFVFVGDGVEKPALEALVKQKNLANVRFLDRQPPLRMPYLYALADVLLAHLKRDPLFDITIPSKTLPYLACGRPILMAVAGDAADVARQAGAGLICEPENPQAIADAIRQFYTMSPQERACFGNAGRKAFLEQYAQEVLLEKWEQLLYEVASSQHRRRGPV